MQTASLAQLKQELLQRPHAEVVDAFMKVLKYKKDNKEFLTYLLFESGQEAAFILDAKEEMRSLFTDVNTTNLFFAKKTIRKILSRIQKYTRFSDKADTTIELLATFCEHLNTLPKRIRQTPLMSTLYRRQIDKIDKAILSLHEDLQFDYRDRMEMLRRAV